MYELLIVAIALFLGGTVQSIGGFGSMLIAMPLVTHVLPLNIAAPLLATLALPVTLVIFYNNRGGIDWRETGRIVAGSIAGVPLGLWSLEHVDSSIIMRFLGGLLVTYSLYALVVEPRLLAKSLPARKGSALLGLIAGLFSGTLGGAFNTSGPPLIVYGDWLRWPKDRFKALLQSVFLVNGCCIIAGHVYFGNVTAAMLPYGAAAFPGILLGLWAGHRIDRYVNPHHFRVTVLILLACMGTSLLMR